MSCLSAYIKRIGGCINATIEGCESIILSISRIGQSPVVTTADIGEKLKVRCGLVCSVSDTHKYLEVEPDIIWLIPENGFSQDVVVYSNVEWVIE